MEKGNKSEEIQTTINHAPLHSWSFAHSYSYCLKLKKHRNKATEKMMSQTDDSEWTFLSARSSMDICWNHLQIFSRRHNSCTWRESPRRRRVSDWSEVLRAGRQKLLLTIEIVGFLVPQSGTTCANLSDLAKVSQLLKSGRCFNTRIPSNFKGNLTVKFLVSFWNFLSRSYLDQVLKGENWIWKILSR